MTNNSSTGGFIVPNPAPEPQPLEGTALLDIIQETLVGVTGINSDLVRPRFQTEPPNIPASGTCWLSFGIARRPGDTFPVIQHDGSADDGQGYDYFQRQERLVVLCSFYDDGATGQALGAAANLRDGIQIPQNMEALMENNIALVAVGEIIPLPVMIKTQWLFRCDLEVTFTRQMERSYPILNLESVEVTINSGIKQVTVLIEDDE